MEKDISQSHMQSNHSVDFERAFGFVRHAQIARDLGLTVEIVRDPDLGYDLDLPEDLPS